MKMTFEKNYTAHNEAETEQIATGFAKNLKGGEVIYYHGDLGSGKTFFTRSVCEALGFTGYVNSPSYIILNEYKTEKFNIYHYDLYRTSSVDELGEIGFFDFPGKADTLTFVEWSELLEENEIDCNCYYDIIISSLNAEEREITIRKFSK